MTKPTAEEALEWLDTVEAPRMTNGRNGWLITWDRGGINIAAAHGSTPLEAIRNAMKGESDE